MQPLEKSLRSKLENTIKEARDIAEDAARSALNQLGVGEAIAFPYLSDSERELRRKLRVHGRQLGDKLNGNAQEIERLVEEVAYEHWHRMLFARFLAENNLLMYPDPNQPVPITLADCEDLAADEGAKNGWELAARFAARMLPQIFRPDSPVFQLELPPEYQQKLERKVSELPVEVFFASDSLGWVYQFWQAKKKELINKSEVKIGAWELPAVTQLFTEPYMVSFLLDNSLGAWWAAHRLTEGDLATAKTEEELRSKVALPNMPLEYLRFVKGEDGKWQPAAGNFEGWPAHLSELKTLDPCCGSGHFLVAALLMLVPIRIEMEKLSAREAIDAVLRDNLHGLEIDQRCIEIAAFALAVTAWNYPNAGGYRKLPPLNLACTGLSVSVAKEEWKQLALDKQNLKLALDWMYEVFKDAPVLGSLLNPAKSQATKLVSWDELSQTLEQALLQEQTDEEHEMGVVAYGLSKAAKFLAGKYHWVITNVPYLGRGDQNETLRDFCDKQYPAAKNNIANVFLERCLELCLNSGTSCVVLPQNWLFLTSYKKFRENLLKNDSWHLIARLGTDAFQTPMWDFNVQLITISSGRSGNKGFFEQLQQNNIGLISGLDVSSSRSAAEKAKQLVLAEIKVIEQNKQLENPDARVAFEEQNEGKLLQDYSYSYHGLTSGDMPRMKFAYWEVKDKDKVWIPYQGTVNASILFGGNEYVLRWNNGLGAINELLGARKDGTGAWGKQGVVVNQMTYLPVTIYASYAFDNNTAVIVPHNPDHLPAIWCFCSSPEYNEAVRQIDQSLKVTNATLVKVPFDLEYWTDVATEKYPNGLPKPYSDDPTQWIFHGHPPKSNKPLQVAVARLVGYRWPAELDAEMELSDEARNLANKCDELLSYADEDGIVCIPSVRGEAPASERLLNLLVAAYGNEWNKDKLNELLQQVGHSGKTLETWLRDKFFTQHYTLFHDRPFVWHIWDGLRDGFAALVNYHKLDAKLLETLIYTYLGDWISRQKADAQNGVDGALEKLDAAENLKKRLELIRQGETPYDIFVRWKPIEQQPIGWQPDLNDGVRLNIRPFLSVPDVGKKGAGVLRDKPNINWGKDRGKDVESAPWYHLFKGDRINDHHLTLMEKRVAKETTK